MQKIRATLIVMVGTSLAVQAGLLVVAPYATPPKDFTTATGQLIGDAAVTGGIDVGGTANGIATIPAAIGSGDSASFQWDTSTAVDGIQSYAYGRVAVSHGTTNVATYNAMRYGIQFDYRPFNTLPGGTSTLVNDTGYILGLDSAFFEIQMATYTRLRGNTATYGVTFTSPLAALPDLNVGNTTTESGPFSTTEWTRFLLVHTGETGFDGTNAYSVWEAYAGTPGGTLSLLGTFGGRQGVVPTSWRIGDGDQTYGSKKNSLGYLDNFVIGTVIPEPASLTMLALAALCGIRKRQNAK